MDTKSSVIFLQSEVQKTFRLCCRGLGTERGGMPYDEVKYAVSSGVRMNGRCEPATP